MCHIHYIYVNMDRLKCLTSSGLYFMKRLQAPWCALGTVRENILFGKPYDAALYNKVTHTHAHAPFIHPAKEPPPDSAANKELLILTTTRSRSRSRSR